MKFLKYLIFALMGFAGFSSAAVAKTAMVKVSSTLWDIAANNAVRVEGVGTLVGIPKDDTYKSFRFFILTAGHVALGQNLVVEGPDNRNITIFRRFDDFKNDITLLEADERDIPVEFFEVGAFNVPILGDTSKIGLVTPLKLNDRYKYETYIVDLGDLFEFLSSKPDMYTEHQAPSEVLKAPWLKPLPNNYFQNVKDQKLLSKDIKQKSFEINYQFPRGYSGSPLFVHHGGSFIGPAHSVLSGILTTSGSSDKPNTTSATGPVVIQALIARAMARERQPEAPLTWCLVDGTFVTLGTNVDMFAFSGPIGNGIVVEGMTTGERESSRNEVSQRLGRMGVSEGQSQELRSELMGIRQQLKNSSGGRSNNQILQKTLNSGLKVYLK